MAPNTKPGTWKVLKQRQSSVVSSLTPDLLCFWLLSKSFGIVFTLNFSKYETD